MQIYIHHNNQQLGPFTEAEIKAQLASGAISPEAHVWWQGQAGWVPLSQSQFATTGGATAPGVPSAAGITPAADTAPDGIAPRTSQMAIWSLILGCLGFFFSIFTSIPAVILGHMSLSRIKKNPGMKGHGIALAGTILGYVFTALLPVVAIIAISVLIALGNQVKGTFNTIDAQLKAAQATNSADHAATAPDQSTNAPDQNTPVPTPSPDQSTNAAPASTPSPDSSTTNSAPATNAPDSSTNTAPTNQ